MSRVLSVIAATAIGLAAGTNYGFSAWAPQFAERLHLTATQINLIGTFGNLGMYAVGIPAGALIDTRGPRWGAVFGAICLTAYFLLRAAYIQGESSVVLLCCYSFLTGMGSCSAFSSAIKVAATNWPQHRGTATAFPLSGFGLSALLFTTLSALIFPDDTGGLLLLLGLGTVVTIAVSTVFLKLVVSGYVPIEEDKEELTGLAMMRTYRFWLLLVMLGLLGGVGLMTINNIGNDAKALWHHYDDSASHDFIQKRQLMHVGILSLFSFVGRLCSGIGSDWLVHHKASRFWTLVASSAIFAGAQVVGFALENPNHLFWLSGLTGLGYGALFGVFPALVADAFGAAGMASNWGAMILAPVVSGFVYNLVYGAVLDSHTIDGVCEEGRRCYSAAYLVTLVSSLAGMAWAFWCMHNESVKKEKSRDHDV